MVGLLAQSLTSRNPKPIPNTLAALRAPQDGQLWLQILAMRGSHNSNNLLSIGYPGTLAFLPVFVGGVPPVITHALASFDLRQANAAFFRGL
jgi:hypothetical protein